MDPQSALHSSHFELDFLPFEFRLRAFYDPGTCIDVHAVFVDQGGPQGDPEFAISAKVEGANRRCIKAALDRFEFGD